MTKEKRVFEINVFGIDDGEKVKTRFGSEMEPGVIGKLTLEFELEPDHYNSNAFAEMLKQKEVEFLDMVIGSEIVEVSK